MVTRTYVQCLPSLLVALLLPFSMSACAADEQPTSVSRGLARSEVADIAKGERSAAQNRPGETSGPDERSEVSQPVEDAPEVAVAETTYPARGPKPRLHGRLSKGAIRRAIRRQVGSIRRCGDEAMQRVADVVPGATADFTIGPTGSVIEALLRDPCSDDPEFLRCLYSAIMKMTFPPPEGGGIVKVTSYPFGITTTQGCSIGCKPATNERYPASAGKKRKTDPLMPLE